MGQRDWVYTLIRIIALPIMKIFFRFEVHNKNCLPSEGRYIICSNHISIVDPILLMVTQKRKICFMAKNELFQNKLFGKLLYAVGVFPVNRDKTDLRAISEAEEILKNEKVMGIFLEGTRSRNGEFLKPKAGAAMIAYNTNTKILPVCITCGDMGRVRLFKKVIISYGDVISPNELGILQGKGTEFRNASREIMSKLSELRNSSAR